VWRREERLATGAEVDALATLRIQGDHIRHLRQPPRFQLLRDLRNGHKRERQRTLDSVHTALTLGQELVYARANRSAKVANALKFMASMSVATGLSGSGSGRSGWRLPAIDRTFHTTRTTPTNQYKISVADGAERFVD
jgi:hypothetical protein